LRFGDLLKTKRSAGRWWSSDKADWKSVVVKMIWASLVGTPFHEKAIAQAQHHSQNQHSVLISLESKRKHLGELSEEYRKLNFGPWHPFKVFS
jgi:hypothetical protein